MYGEFYNDILASVRQELERQKPEIIQEVTTEIKKEIKQTLKEQKTQIVGEAADTIKQQLMRNILGKNEIENNTKGEI